MPLISPFFRLPGRWRRLRPRRNRMTLQLILLLLLLVLISPLYIAYKPPTFLVNWAQRRFPQVLFRIQTSQKLVALTIDDTPSTHTKDLLEILIANKARATFFTIGNQVPGHEDTLQDILRADCELGNHAMHDEPSISLESGVLLNQINEVDKFIDDAYQKSGKDRKAHLFRPGSGVFSQRILDMARSAGYQTILGSIYPHDPFIKYWRINAWNILSGIRPGAVIICHDRRSWTVPMLAKVVPEIKRRGYEIVTVSELLTLRDGDSRVALS